MMKSARILLVAAALAAAGCTTPKEVFAPMHPHWQVFTSTQARHSADFPGHSRQSLKETKMVSGPTASTYLREVQLSDRYFGTAWTQVPGDTASQAARDRLLEIAAAEAVKSTGGKLLTKERVANEGIPGLAYVIDIPQSKTRLRQQIFIASGVLLEQTYAGPAGTEDERDPGRFFDSLKLLP